MSITNTFKKINNFIQKEQTKNILYHSFIIFMLVFLVVLSIHLCYGKSFWLDEISSITFIRKKLSLYDTLKIFMTIDIYNLPLYALFLFFSYRIFNYTEFSLIIPGIVFSIIGIYFLLKILRKFFGRFIPCLILLLILWEVRCYGLLFMLSNILTYVYINRIENESIKNIVIYGIIGTLLAYTHWFGGILIFLYFIGDVYLYIKKKINIKCILSYVIIDCLFIPWIILIILNIVNDISHFWITVPNIDDIILTINSLLGIEFTPKLYFPLLIIGGIVFTLIFNKKKLGNRLSIEHHMVFIVITLFFCIYVYSVYIYSNVSLFLTRYFVVILPHIYFIIANFFNTLQHFIMKKFKLLSYCFCIIIVSFGCSNQIQNFKTFKNNYNIDYNVLTNFLTKDNDISNEKTIIINDTSMYWSKDGYLEFYFSNRNLKLPNKYVKEIEIDELLKYDKIYYLSDKNNNFITDYMLKHLNIFYFDYYQSDKNVNIDYFLNEETYKILTDNNYELIDYDLNLFAFKFVRK